MREGPPTLDYASPAQDDPCPPEPQEPGCLADLLGTALGSLAGLALWVILCLLVIPLDGGMKFIVMSVFLPVFLRVGGRLGPSLFAKLFMRKPNPTDRPMNEMGRTPGGRNHRGS